MTEESSKTYEMLWDCEYCGKKKLLGKTHRHCPECGAVQNPNARYFPEENEKIAVEDHVFVGADCHCPACNGPNSAQAKFCYECGAPMDGSKEVEGKTDEPTTPPAPATSPKENSKKVPIIIGAVLIVIVAMIAVFFLWKKEVGLVAAEHNWAREIKIEQFKELTESNWCDSMPRDAVFISKSEQVRSHEKIADGETCTTKRIDNKDGTYKQKKVCKTKYKEKPVYDQKCRYRVKRWAYLKSEKTAGKGLAVIPFWPTLKLPASSSVRPTLGALRSGQKIETNNVVFKDTHGKLYSCSFPMANWRSIPVGSKWSGKVGAISNSLDCTSLKPQK